MKYFIHQLGQSDCGYTCIKILLAKLNHDQNYLFDTKNFNNLSLLEMEKILKENKVEAIGVEVTSIDNLKKYYYPIVLIKNSKANHYVLLKRVTKKRVIIIDPVQGKRILPKEEFEKVFTKYALISKRKKKVKYIKKAKLFDKNYLISYVSSLFIDFGLIYFLGFVIKNEKNFLLPSLLFLGIIINLIFKFIIIFSYSKVFDKKYVEPLIDQKIDMNDLNLVGKYKISKINIFKNIGLIMVTLFIIVILSVNQIFNLYFVILVGVFLIIKKIIFENIYLIYKEKIAKLEEEYWYKRDKEIYSLINHISKKLVLFKTSEKIAIIVIIFAYLLLLSYFTKEKSINFILFYFFSYYSIYGLMNLICNLNEPFVELKDNFLNYQKIMSKYK